jgi:hypothetical protein
MTLLLDYCSPSDILPRENSWEVLSKKGVEVARLAVRERGVIIPPLVDGQNRAISGWVWVLAAQQEQLNRRSNWARRACASPPPLHTSAVTLASSIIAPARAQSSRNEALRVVHSRQ